jgi:hypothetical protein
MKIYQQKPNYYKAIVKAYPSKDQSPDNVE